MSNTMQVSTILQAIPCEAFPNPSAQYSYDADPEGLEEVQDAVKISLDTPTEARPVVVAFCLDGSRSLVVCNTPSPLGTLTVRLELLLNQPNVRFVESFLVLLNMCLANDFGEYIV